MNEARRRKVLYDLPVANDGFSGGGHNRTASSLANTIREFDDQTRSIGLEGKWGSGKSTIVEIAKNILDAGKDARTYHVFTFDLWTNQNTNFKRAFLESFLTWLSVLDTGKGSFVTRMRDKIRDRVVDTRTTNVRIFSGFGLFFLCFLFVLPWLYSWLSPSAINSGSRLPRMTVVAALFIAVMIIGVLLIGIRAYKKSKVADSGVSLTFAEALSNTLSLFSKDAQKVHVKQNIRELDPTQNEFESTLKEILSEFQGEGRRIIVVFDNIDRLPSDRIIDAWSDIRGVLSSSRHDDVAKKRLTVIVPYDRSHVLRAMYPESGISEIHQDDIFRKSFDAIFFVAPPVVSDSIAFFNKKLKEALGDNFDENEAYRVFKIFELSRSDEAPTPRQVIAFINSIATLWEQWGDVIPLPTIAVFMLHRDDIDKRVEMLRKEDSIDSRYRELSDDPNLFQNLAALAFNVEPHFAFQVLLHSRIEQVFTSDDPSMVKDLAASPGFEVMLPEVYADGAQRWASDSLTQFKHAAYNLSTLDRNKPSTSQSKKKVLDAIEHLQETPPSEWEKCYPMLGLYSICTAMDARRLTVLLTDWLTRCLPGKESDRSILQGQQWVGFVGRMFAAAKGDDTEEDEFCGFDEIRVPSGEDFLIGAAYDADLAGIKIAMFKSLPRGDAFLARALDGKLVDYPEQFFYAWPQLQHLIESYTTRELIERAAEKLSSEIYSSKSDVLRYLVGNFNILFEGSDKSDTFLQARKKLVNGGSLYGNIFGLRDSAGEDAIEARAGALWLVLDHYRGNPLPSGDLIHPILGNLTEAKAFVEGVLGGGLIDSGTFGLLVDQVIRYDRINEWIISAAEATYDVPLFLELIKAVVVSDRMVGLSITVFIDHYDFLKDLFGEKIGKVLASFGSATDNARFKSIDYATVPASLVTDIGDGQEAGWTQFFVGVDAWLRSLDAEAWRRAMASSGREIEVLRSRVRVAGFTVSSSVFRDPLADHVIGILTGEHAASIGFDEVIDALPSNSREGLASLLLQRLAKEVVTSSALESAFESYPKLLDRLPFEEDAETTVRKILIPTIQGASDQGMAFLERHRVIFQEVVRNVSASLLGEVQEFIGAESTEDGEATIRRKRCFRLALDLPAFTAAKIEEAGALRSTGDEP